MENTTAEDDAFGVNALRREAALRFIVLLQALVREGVCEEEALQAF